MGDNGLFLLDPSRVMISKELIKNQVECKVDVKSSLCVDCLNVLFPFPKTDLSTAFSRNKTRSDPSDRRLKTNSSMSRLDFRSFNFLIVSRPEVSISWRTLLSSCFNACVHDVNS